MTRTDTPSRETIITQLNEVYRGPAWHGPAVLEALEGVNATVARAKPNPARHSIWELVRHLTHGRHLLVERLTETLSEFPHAVREPWWPVVPSETSEPAWREDLSLLEGYHDRLIDAVRNASDAQLARRPNDVDQTLAQQLLGMAIHDAYHAGQIRLLALNAG
ncbi:MAG TPA: DinB family protein [Gemmatimonadaceae bacterium]